MGLGGKYFITFCLYYIITVRKISIGKALKIEYVEVFSDNTVLYL